MNEILEVLQEINANLKGIREELNYMNGITVTQEGSKLSRNHMARINTPILNSMQQGLMRDADK